MSRTSAAAASVHSDGLAEYVESVESEETSHDIGIGTEVSDETFDDPFADFAENHDPESSEDAAGDSSEGSEEEGTTEDSLHGRSGSDRDSVAAEKRAARRRLSLESATGLSSLSDHDLLEGIRAQSEVHFAELYNRYFQRIYNFVYARMRNHAETEEVVQETFLAVFRSFENYRGQSSLLSWIYGIAKNTTNNSLRRAKSQSERIDLADEEDLLPRGSIDVGMPDEQLDLHRFREQLTERLDTLASWQAEIFEMRHFENLSIPEISERTSRSSDAVRSSLYRVKRMFLEAAVASGGTPAAAGGGRR